MPNANYTPEHSERHRQGGDDEITVDALAASSTDTALVLKPDGSGGLQWGSDSDSGGPTDQEVAQLSIREHFGAIDPGLPLVSGRVTNGGSFSVPTGEVWAVQISGYGDGGSWAYELNGYTVRGSQQSPNHGRDVWTILNGGDTIASNATGSVVYVSGYDISGLNHPTVVSTQINDSQTASVPTGTQWHVWVTVGGTSGMAGLDVDGAESIAAQENEHIANGFHVFPAGTSFGSSRTGASVHLQGFEV